MEKENQISIQEEKHKKNKKLPKEVSQAILKKIVYNILKAIGIIIYFAILNLAYIRMNQVNLIKNLATSRASTLCARSLLTPEHKECTLKPEEHIMCTNGRGINEVGAGTEEPSSYQRTHKEANGRRNRNHEIILGDV